MNQTRTYDGQQAKPTPRASWYMIII